MSTILARPSRRDDSPSDQVTLILRRCAMYQVHQLQDVLALKQDQTRCPLRLSSQTWLVEVGMCEATDFTRCERVTWSRKLSGSSHCYGSTPLAPFTGSRQGGVSHDCARLSEPRSFDDGRDRSGSSPHISSQCNGSADASCIPPWHVQVCRYEHHGMLVVPVHTGLVRSRASTVAVHRAATGT